MRDRSKSVKAHPVDRVPAEGTNVLFDVWLVSRATTGLLDAALAPTGLSADEFGIYSVLTSSDGMTPSELARWMSAPSTTVSSYVKRLEGRGHLRRDRNPADGRSYVLRLTPQGAPRTRPRAGASSRSRRGRGCARHAADRPSVGRSAHCVTPSRPWRTPAAEPWSPAASCPSRPTPAGGGSRPARARGDRGHGSPPRSTAEMGRPAPGAPSPRA